MYFNQVILNTVLKQLCKDMQHIKKLGLLNFLV